MKCSSDRDNDLPLRLSKCLPRAPQSMAAAFSGWWGRAASLSGRKCGRGSPETPQRLLLRSEFDRKVVFQEVGSNAIKTQGFPDFTFKFSKCLCLNC